MTPPDCFELPALTLPELLQLGAMLLAVAALIFWAGTQGRP